MRDHREMGRERRGSYFGLFLIVLFILVATLAASLYYLFVGDITEEEDSIASEVVDITDESESVEELPAKIYFQPIVDEWAESVGGNKSVLIYDLERDEVAAEYNIDEEYGTASLYKLFVVYEGYKRVQNGEWDAEEMVGSTGYNMSKCLDLAIRESYSPCAEALWARLGHDELDEIIENDFKITDSDISGLVSNVNDIMKIMKIFYKHEEITDETLIAAMKDSFLNQPETTYDWRQGLPSGFAEANVYNKVGWDYNVNGGYWNIYHDAAIVEWPENNRHFIVVVMTNQVDYSDIARLGQEIEKSLKQS